MSDWDEFDYGDDDDYRDDDDYDDEGKHDDYPDSGDEWGQDLQNFQIGFKDRERLGGGIIGCWVEGIDGRPLKTQTPEGRFCLRVNAVSRNINDSCGGKLLSEADIQILLDKSPGAHRVRYKNPTAFVLGYIATGRGTRVITKDSLNVTWVCYEKTAGGIDRDESIKKPDIIRYARLWKK